MKRHLVVLVLVVAALAGAGCVESGPEPSSFDDFTLLDARFDTQHTNSTVDTQLEERIQVLVWEYVVSGQFDTKGVANLRNVSTEMVSQSYVSLHAAEEVGFPYGPTHLTGQTMIVDLGGDWRPGGLLCGPSICHEAASRVPVGPLKRAVQNYLNVTASPS